MDNGTGCVYLVGAGCGGSDLMTLRGMELLGRCDAVVYDDLIAESLLEAAPPEAERIYVGKRSGRHSASQAEICGLLVEKAREGKTVVRLKGGDPFVFGRGGEEVLALREAGASWELVPGISSAVAIPELAGIPVTHRGLSRSFHVITAHTAEGLPKDLERLAGLGGTLVFLMGLERLEWIARQLAEAGMDLETPAAVVSGGNAPHPVTVRGTLGDIAKKAAGVLGPAVIVVGKTAALDLSPGISRPLEGVSIALTGTDAMARKLRTRIEALGGRPFRAQRSVVKALEFQVEPVLEREAWLVFTSGNGVECFFRRLREQRVDLRKLSGRRFAVIGAATGKKLESFGIYPDLCPQEFTSEALGHALRERVPRGAAVWLLRSRQGSPVLRELLEDGYELHDVPVYEIESDPEVGQAAAGRLEKAEYLVFSSGSGVELFLRTCGAIPAQAVCVCIGGVTAQTLQKHYGGSFLTAVGTSAEEIVKTIANHVMLSAVGKRDGDFKGNGFVS